MKRILFITNIPSPYRVHFFGELGKYVNLTVLYANDQADHSNRNAAWFIEGQGNYRSEFLKKRILKHGEDSLCLDVIHWIKQDYDHIIVSGYSTPTVMLAIAWLKLHRKPFWMEVDGGVIREDSGIKYLIKKMLISAPSGWISSGRYTTKYLVHYGAKEECVKHYPFSSLWEADILPEPVSRQEKQRLREELGIPEKHMVLSVGQFIHRKGFDLLLQAATSVSGDVGIYIVGGEATEAYLALRDRLNLDNVHFLGFHKKDSLGKLYRAADMFVLPTREDIWGLVINEALANGLPTVTTDRCVAGLELIENGVNGYVVPVEDPAALAEKINMVLAADPEQMGVGALDSVRGYTIENMVKSHMEFLSEQEK